MMDLALLHDTYQFWCKRFLLSSESTATFYPLNQVAIPHPYMPSGSHSGCQDLFYFRKVSLGFGGGEGHRGGYREHCLKLKTTNEYVVMV